MGCTNSLHEKEGIGVKNVNNLGENEYDLILKLLMIGDSGVGKSSLLLRYSNDIFTESFISTIGVDFKIKKLDIGGKKIKLQIWDTSGQERFQTITKSYYRGANGVIIVYDITNLHTFNNIQKWIGELEINSKDDIKMLIIGNKCDLENLRVVTKECGEKLAETLKIPFIETSTKNSINTDEAFLSITQEMLKRHFMDVDD